MSNYKSISFYDSSNFNFLSNQSVKHYDKVLIPNPQKYFSDLENALLTGNNQVKEEKLKNFCKLTKEKNFLYYPSFASSKIPAIFMNILISQEESDQYYLGIILNIILNLSSDDQYCNLFSNDDIIHILINLFQNNISKNNISDISLYSISSIFNFSSSSITFRDVAFQYILPLIKYAQKKEESQIKTLVFRFILSMTYFNIDQDQLKQILNAILILLDYVDETATLILTLTLRKLSDYFEDLFMYISNTSIFDFLSRNLLSSQTNVVYLTLLIFTSFFKKYSFPEISDIPEIIKFLESRSIDLVKVTCQALTYIVQNSPQALDIQYLHQITQLIVSILEDRKVDTKGYLMNFLNLLFNKYAELIDDANSQSFFVALSDCLYSDNDDLLIQTLNIANVIVTKENDREDDNNMPLFDFLCEKENHELIDQLQNHQNSIVSQSSIQLLKLLRF